jgi:hypothetical protein
MAFLADAGYMPFQTVTVRGPLQKESVSRSKTGPFYRRLTNGVSIFVPERESSTSLVTKP